MVVAKQAAGSRLKWLSLVLMIFQMVTLVLTMRHTRTTCKSGAGCYLTSTAVANAELVKVVVATLLLINERRHTSSVFGTFAYIAKTLMSDMVDTMKLAVPSALYTAQNNLLYVGLSNLDAATYQVTYQLKVLSTAILSVIILKRTLGVHQWLSLFVLFAGVTLVQMPSDHAPTPSQSANQDINVTTAPDTSNNAWLGLMAVLTACFTSGFAGVFTEKLIKGGSTSLWFRNIQLGLFGFLFAIVGVFVNDGDAVAQQGYLQHYDGLVWAVVVIQAVGGLVIAAVMKFADNIVKGFGSAISIVIIGVVSVMIGDSRPSLFFAGGSTLVITSTFMYSGHIPIPSVILGMFSTSASSVSGSKRTD